MCRWIAYAGSPIFIGDLLFDTDHSLIDQSLNARESEEITNGDGFGIGWYDKRPYPGVFRDVFPAWNDANLNAIATQTRSGLFFAHIRAATGTPVQRTNSHPFKHDNWLFQHNGLIPDFARVKHALAMRVDPDLYPYIFGSTDSELMFYLALTLGLRDNPKRGLERMVALVEQTQREAGIDEPLQCSVALCDGTTTYATRYASAAATPRTLYRSKDIARVCDFHADLDDNPKQGTIIASEPLELGEGLWEPIPPSTFLTVDQSGGVETAPFAPAA